MTRASAAHDDVSTTLSLHASSKQQQTKQKDGAHDSDNACADHQHGIHVGRSTEDLEHVLVQSRSSLTEASLRLSLWRLNQKPSALRNTEPIIANAALQS
jgi:hypothetical protein